MADNILLNAGSGGATIRSDDDGTAQWQYVKLAYGADNTQNIVTSTATNPLPVALSDTDNAVLDTIATRLNYGSVTGGGVEATALRVTLASDSTGVLSIDDNGGSITVDNTGLTELAAAINANQLDINIASDSVGIGGGTQYAVDAALGATPTGTVVIAKRDDTLSALTPIEGDAIEARVNARGAIWVELDPTNNVVIADGGGSITTDNAGAFAVQEDGAALTALQLIDDTIYIDDADWTALTSKHALIGGVYQSTPGTITDGDTGPFRVDVNGHLITSAHAETIALADNVSNSANLKVDEAGAFMASATFGYQFDGTAWDRVRGDSTNGLLVNLGANNDVTITGSLPAGTNAIGKLSANSGVDIGDVDVLSMPGVAGDVASDTADSGNPIKIGAYASNSIEGITQVANADRVNLVADLNGVLVTRPHTTLEEGISERVSDTAGTSAAFSTFGAGGAGVHNYITSITVHNAHASTNGYVDIRDGTAGSVLWTVPAPATAGAVIQFDPPLKQTTANTALAYDVSAAITTVYISVNGFQAQG